MLVLFLAAGTAKKYENMHSRGVIKLAASAASTITKNAGQPTYDGSACGQQGRDRPCILVIGEAALGADLIKGLVFKHLERNFA